jgi:hypothetical protein
MLTLYIDVKIFSSLHCGELLKFTARSTRKALCHFRETKPFILIISHLNPVNNLTHGFCNISYNFLCPFATRF